MEFISKYSLSVSDVVKCAVPGHLVPKRRNYQSLRLNQIGNLPLKYRSTI